MKKLFIILPILLCGNVVMGKNMKIQINNTDYDVVVDDNQIANEIFNALPEMMQLSEFANHEYVGNLDFTPTTTEDQTSILGAGHIYYWAPGNAFVINYTEYDISPYKSVHIGEFVDKTVCDVLQNSDDVITINIVKGDE